MKQRFITIVGIALCFSLGLFSSSMALTSQEKGFIERLFEAAGVERSTNNDTKELKNLAKDDAPFENLYLFMYENIKRGPHDAAIADLAIREDYTEKQLEAIVLEGDTSKIIERKQERAAEAQAENALEDQEEAVEAYEAEVDNIVSQMEGLVDESIMNDLREIYNEYGPETLETEELAEVYTHDLITTEFNRILDLYNDELERQRETRKLTYQSISKEIFMNGDLGDSANVDILYELDLIHYLFFGEFMVMPDRSVPATERSINKVGDDGSDDSSTTAYEENEIFLASQNLFPSPAVVRANIEPNDFSELSFDPSTIILTEDDEESLDPYACFDDDELRAALDAFNTEDEIADDEPDTNTDTGTGSTGSNGETADDYEPFEADDYEGDDDEAQVLSALEDFAGALGGDAADWSRSLPCNDVFCITIDLITENGDATEVEESENHIFAHVSYINERIEDTLSKSLVPGKVSMNWFEDGTCKEAGLLINLDLNVEAIAVPIDLDPGDDIDEKAAEDVKGFQDELAILRDVDTDYGCTSILNLANFVDDVVTIEEFNERCQQQEDIFEQELRALYDSFIIETQVQSNSTLFEQMSAEIATFLLYIQTFEESLKKTYVTGQAPLWSMVNKPYCQ